MRRKVPGEVESAVTSAGPSHPKIGDCRILPAKIQKKGARGASQPAELSKR